MAKINLNILSFDEAMIFINKYQKNRYKNGINSWGNDDPYITERCIMKKFICSKELAISFIDHLLTRDNRYTHYVEHFV